MTGVNPDQPRKSRRAAARLTIGVLWLLTLAGSWYAGQQQIGAALMGLPQTFTSAPPSDARDCRLVQVRLGNQPSQQDLNDINGMQGQGYRIMSNEPGPGTGGQYGGTRLITLCR